MDIFIYSARVCSLMPVYHFDINELMAIRQILFCISMNRPAGYKLVWLRSDGTQIDA